MPKTITITQDGNSPLTREDLIKLCTPEWTKKYNPNGHIRVDDIVQVMSICSGLLLEHLQETLNPDTIEAERKFDGGGDDTAADYIPCALENIGNVCALHLNLAYEGEKSDIKPELYPYIKDNQLCLMDEDTLTPEQIAIYREYTQLAGAKWDEYDELNA